LSSIKQLAGHTFWYGVSSIGARFISYLLAPILTYSLANMSDYGKVGLIYSAIPLLNVVFTYGFETTYFRFAGRAEFKKDLYSTSSLSLFFSTIFLTAILWYYRAAFGAVIGLSAFPQIIQISIFIIATDALTRIPFAKLRQEGRPRKYAFINIMGILINIFFIWFYIIYCPGHTGAKSNLLVAAVYNENTNPVVYVVLSQLYQSIFTFLCLWGEIRQVKFTFNVKLWKEMMIYSLPLLIAGMGGMINETFDRVMLYWWLPGSAEYREQQVGIYNACYKLSILITLFVQAFRLGAEPFFFSQAENGNPQKTYARVMKFFVITLSIVFLLINLFLPIWKWFIKPPYWVGLTVVPVLVLANICLGIYYSLSIWYKLTNKTMAGAVITLIAAGVTILVNWIFIPKFGFLASAWATFAAYFTLMLISFIWGQKAYFVPYQWKKLLAYLAITIIIFFIHKFITSLWENETFALLLSTIFTTAFILFILKIEKKEFQEVPYIGKWIKKI